MNSVNPELRRNLWLEFSTHRVIAAPVVITLIGALIVAAGGRDVLDKMAMFAAFGYAAVTMLWGARLAGASVIDEARERTWDAQRMSSITPWAMTWGKLLGATAFTWYAGGILLLIFVITGSQVRLPVLRYAALMLCGAVMLHAMALNGSVLAARKGMARRGTGTVLVVFLAFMWLAPGLRVLDSMDKPVAWWGTAVTQLDFALGTAAAFGAWAVLGAYRSMCNELEIRTTPWALPAFILFTAAYGAGFPLRSIHSVFEGKAFFGVMATGVVVSMALVYALLLAEKSSATEWQRLCARVRASQWRRALQELPLWLVALTVGLIMALAASVSGGAGSGPFLHKVGTAPIALMLFAVRDAAIFQLFALARQPRRVEAATLFYLVLLYGLLPGLLKAFGADAVAQFILPPLTQNPLFTTAVMAVQAAIAIALAYARWRRIHAPDVAK
jgi:hypothetical protein